MKTERTRDERPSPNARPESHRLADAGAYPNSRYPALIYRQALPPGAASGRRLAQRFEDLFGENGWPSAWRNGLYKVHHYHSTAHEALGIFSGEVKVQLGGPEGPVVTARAGDVIVVPAGVSHKNVGQSGDFHTVGAYPRGTSWDMQYGERGERPETDRNIAAVPFPKADPVAGSNGWLPKLWSAAK